MKRVPLTEGVALDPHVSATLAVAFGADHQNVASHWYTVPPVAQQRILHAAAVLDVRDLVRVWDWHPGAARCD